jgi:hypothetical protein
MPFGGTQSGIPTPIFDHQTGPRYAPAKREDDLAMPLRREVQFLRERARRLREMADENPTALSDRLRAMAHELEARADNLERVGFTDNGDGSP